MLRSFSKSFDHAQNTTIRFNGHRATERELEERRPINVERIERHALCMGRWRVAEWGKGDRVRLTTH